MLLSPAVGMAQGDSTPAGEAALAEGLEWLASRQGPEGNWESNDLGLVGLGALAFLAAGHAPGRGQYGAVVQNALDYVVDHAQPSGLLNRSNKQRDMYNHGLATFVLGQAYGTETRTNSTLNRSLGRAILLIAETQCEDGGWDYRARSLKRGHDLSLVVMQAKALRSAVDSGLDVPQDVIDAAIANVRSYYTPENGDLDATEEEQRRFAGQFTYSQGGGGPTVAMAAAGVVCLQEFGEFDDWRIKKSMQPIREAISNLPAAKTDGTLPFDAYTTYYVSQALFQMGGEDWQEGYPPLRDYLVQSQLGRENSQSAPWRDNGARGGGKVGGRPGELFGTAVACLVLALPNRFLPILQQPRPDSPNPGSSN